MTDNQPKPPYREFTQNTRKVARSAFGKLLHEEFLTPHKITQRRLSKVSGVAAEDISRMVTGERYPYDPTLYNNLYALFKALAELGVPLTDDQVSKVLQVKEIHARLSDTRQAELIDVLQDDGVVKIAYQTSQQEADSPYQSAGQATPESSWIDNLPFRQNSFFTGRETELEQLRKQLQETGNSTITQPVSISGLGGIGKTELALEYAHSFYPDLYRVALWVNAADEDTLRASYYELAKTLKLPEWDEQKLDQCVPAVKDWLKMHTNWLLIMDNADDLPLAESFLPAKPLGHVVFTTRSHSIGSTATESNHIEVEKMESDDGLLLLLLRSHKIKHRTELDKVTTGIRDTAHEVVKLLGGYPLALDQAGAYIEGTGVSFTDYVNRYYDERRRLLNRRRLRKSKDSEHGRHPLPVDATLYLSIQEACKGQPLASDILHFCAFLQPDAIPEELFQHDDSFKYDTTEFDDAIEALHSHSLIKRSTQERTFSMHRLVQAVLIDDMPSDFQEQWRERIVSALNAAFPEVILIENWWQCMRLLSHVLFCATWSEQQLIPTRDVAELLHKAAIYLREEFRFSEAETLLSRVLSIYEQQLVAEHSDTATVLVDLAVLYLAQRKYEEGKYLYLQALEIQGSQLGTDFPKFTITPQHLATIYMKQGNFEEAQAMYERIFSLDLQKFFSDFGATYPPTQTTKSLAQDADTSV